MFSKRRFIMVKAEVGANIGFDRSVAQVAGNAGAGSLGQGSSSYSMETNVAGALWSHNCRL
jgi:hypothetical protein